MPTGVERMPSKRRTRAGCGDVQHRGSGGPTQKDWDYWNALGRACASLPPLDAPAPRALSQVLAALTRLRSRMGSTPSSNDWNGHLRCIQTFAADAQAPP